MNSGKGGRQARPSRPQQNPLGICLGDFVCIFITMEGVPVFLKTVFITPFCTRLTLYRGVRTPYTNRYMEEEKKTRIEQLLREGKTRLEVRSVCIGEGYDLTSTMRGPGRPKRN